MQRIIWRNFKLPTNRFIRRLSEVCEKRIKNNYQSSKRTVYYGMFLTSIVVLATFYLRPQIFNSIMRLERRGVLEDLSTILSEESDSSQNSHSVLDALLQDGYEVIRLSKLCLYELKVAERQMMSIASVQARTLKHTPKRTPMTTRMPIFATHNSSSTSSSSSTQRNFSVPHSSSLPNSTSAVPSSPNLLRDDDNLKNHTVIRLSNRSCEAQRRLKVTDSSFLVPDVVHYVFIGSDFKFTFITYLSFLSVHMFLRPSQIFIHGDVTPSGEWWKVTKEQVDNIYHVQRSYSKKAPNGQSFKFTAHISDYIRAEILIRYGGIYLDPDVLVLKSFAPLLQHPLVLGRESGDSVGNGIIISRKGSLFLRLLLEQYWSYKGPNEEWAKQSVHNVHTLIQVYPHLVHVEETSLNRPNWMERKEIYEGNYDWKNNYAMHLWLRLWPKETVPHGLDDLLNATTTIGQMARHILSPSD